MVEWSKPAKTDLKQIHDYIAKDSKHYAKKVAQTVVEKAEKLKTIPKWVGSCRKSMMQR